MSCTARMIGIVTGCGIALTTFAGSAFAQERVGQITAASGPVTVTRAADGSVDEATQMGPRVRNGSVFALDVVATGAGAGATLVFADGSSVKLVASTSLAVRASSTITPAGQKTTTGRAIKILAGKVFAEINPEGGVTTEFETPTGVAAVKGTVLEIEVGGTGVTP